jgi:chromosome segregation ATPase
MKNPLDAITGKDLQLKVEEYTDTYGDVLVGLHSDVKGLGSDVKGLRGEIDQHGNQTRSLAQGSEAAVRDLRDLRGVVRNHSDAQRKALSEVDDRLGGIRTDLDRNHVDTQAIVQQWVAAVTDIRSTVDEHAAAYGDELATLDTEFRALRDRVDWTSAETLSLVQQWEPTIADLRSSVERLDIAHEDVRASIDRCETLAGDFGETRRALMRSVEAVDERVGSCLVAVQGLERLCAEFTEWQKEQENQTTGLQTDTEDLRGRTSHLQDRAGELTRQMAELADCRSKMSRLYLLVYVGWALTLVAGAMLWIAV